jgi:Transposase DDE domain/Insertion element 4 transposase N-terminal
MYRLREMDVDDKVCEQVEIALLEEVYPKAVMERCVKESQMWLRKKRRVRQSTGVAVAWFVIGMGLWSRCNQSQVWQKLVGKLSDIHPAEPEDALSDSALSRRRQELGSQGLQRLMQTCCVPLARPSRMPSAFFGRYRLMAIDGTVFNAPDTAANERTFGRSQNQYGKGAYPQVRCVLLAECGSHAVVGLEMDHYEVSEVHGAHRLLAQVSKDMLVMSDAGITAGGFFEPVRDQGAHALGALEAGAWEHLATQRRLCDGSRLVWVPASRNVCYPMRKGMWVRILPYQITDERLGEAGKTYRLATTLLNPRVAPALRLIELYHERWEIELVIDEIKTHERAQRKVLRSKTPEGVVQELYGVFLAHYAVRALLAQAAMEADLDPDRLSFTEGLFQLTEMIDLTLTCEPEQVSVSSGKRLRHKIRRQILPERRLRVNRREIKQIYGKYKPKKRDLPPPEPFKPEERFLDFVILLEVLAPPPSQEVA